MQIRTRLTWQFLLIVAGILLAVKTYIYYEVSTHLVNEHYHILKSKANMTAATAIAQIEGRQTVNIPQNTRQFPGYYTENISIFDKDGQQVFSFVAQASPLDDRSLTTVLGQGRDVCYLEGNFAHVLQPFVSQTGQRYVVKAEAVFDRSDLHMLLKTLILLYGAMLTVVAFSGWVFAGRALKPISQIMDDLNSIFPSDMGRRLRSDNKKDELSRLTVTFNDLLDRIQKAFEAQKSFLAHISHELKNPFTVIATQIEIALQKDRPIAEYKHILQSILDDVREVNKVSDNLMQLARLQSGNVEGQFQKIRLDELLLYIKSQLLKVHPTYVIYIQIREAPADDRAMIIHGNEQLLGLALYNLIENSCKFSPDRSAEVRLFWTTSQQPIVDILDKGPGIDAGESGLIFDPFYRGRHAGEFKGTGIGLSLVKSIAELHHIQLSLESRTGGGARFRLAFAGEGLNPSSSPTLPHA
jgi:signal transduction histidine kinase